MNGIRKNLMQVKNNPVLVWHFIIGWYRYLLYNMGLTFLIRNKIVKMYEDRLISAKQCLDNGTCLICGCRTPVSFFVNRDCSAKKLDYEERIFLKGNDIICYTKI